MGDFMKNYLKTNHIFVILGYAAALLFGNLLAIVIFTGIASAKYDITVSQIMNMLSNKDISELNQIEHDCYYFCQSWINFFTYFTIIILVLFFARGFMKTDFLKIKEYKKKNFRYLLYSILGFGLLYGSSVLFSWLVSLVSKTTSSQNQIGIEGMILNGYAFITFITIFLLAPIAEELVYRKAIFKFFDNKKKRIIPIVFSALCFSLPHMLAAEESFVVWLLLFLSYFACGVILSLVYELSDRNVYYSIFAHMLNNLLAFLLIVL